VGLIHMNGRVYDPLLGRFGTPDPMTESPFSTQGWNRYSYVGNSPTNFTDPTGYCFLGCFWKPIFKAIGNFFRRYWGAIVQVVAGAICTFTPGCQPFLVAGLTSAAVTGISSGNLGLALRAGFFSMVTSFITQQVMQGMTSGNGAASAGAPSGLGMGGLQTVATQSSSLVEYAQVQLPGIVVTTPPLGMCITLTCAPVPAPPLPTLSDAAHAGLTAASFLPSFVGAAASGLDGLLYLYKGDRFTAGISFAAAGLGMGASAGVAKKGMAMISEYATRRGPHYSIEVTVGGRSLPTEQIITSSVNDTSIALNTSTGAVRTWSVELPNGQAALDYSNSLLGANTGIYDRLTNSCLSYCGNVLNAGGLNVPINSSLGTYRFLNSLGK
jgi:hypothetical protein